VQVTAVSSHTAVLLSVLMSLLGQEILAGSAVWNVGVRQAEIKERW
jgi:hypothetical protein